MHLVISFTKLYIAIQSLRQHCKFTFSCIIGVKETCHYRDVIICAMASQITSLTIVYSTFFSDADQRKHQSSALLAFVRGIHRWPMNSSHKRSVTRGMFPFDDVVMLTVDSSAPGRYCDCFKSICFKLITKNNTWALAVKFLSCKCHKTSLMVTKPH